MRYLKRYRIFESLERNKDIVSLLGNNQGYYNLFIKFFNDGVSIEELSQLIIRIRNDRNLIKINLTEFKTVEQVDDYLTKIEEDSKYNKILDQLSNRYNNLLSNKVKSLLYDNRDDIELLKMFFKKIKVYKDADHFYTALDNFIKNNKGDFNLNSILPKIDKTSQIVYKDESLLIVKVNTFEQSRSLGSQNWCISRQQYYFDNYSRNRRQYFIWDFTMPAHSNLSQIGVTLEISGQYYTAHYKDDSKCYSEYVTNNFGDYLGMEKYIYNEIILGKMITEPNIESVLNSNKLTAFEKEELVYNVSFARVLLTNPSFFVTVYKIRQKQNKDINFDAYIKSVDDMFKKTYSAQIELILTYLLDNNVDISKIIPLIYIELRTKTSCKIVTKALSDYGLTNLNIKDTSVLSYNINDYSDTILDKLLDILIRKNLIDASTIKSVSKSKYNEIAEKFKNADFMKIPNKMIPFVSTEQIIKDFDFEFTKNIYSGNNSHVIDVLHRLFSNTTHQTEILEMFKSKASTQYNEYVNILKQFDDVKQVDGNFVYHLSDEIVEYFQTKEVYTGYSHKPKHHIIDRVNILQYLRKDYHISDTCEEDIQNFYKEVFKGMSVKEMILSPFYLKHDVPKDVDICAKIDCRHGLTFYIPLDGFYDAWEKAKTDYIDILSLDLWFGFSSAFYENFGFKNNLEKTESNFHNRNLIINPFKIWCIRKLWSFGPDSSEFSDYIMDYCNFRDFYFIEWEYISHTESFHHYLSDELRHACYKYNNTTINI